MSVDFGGRQPNIVGESRRLVSLAAGQGLAIRLLGGVAVHIACPDARRPELTRPYKDIDLATSRKSSRAVRDLLAAEGYEGDRQFNALHGSHRLLFYDMAAERQADVFVGTFDMCHKLNLEPRLKGSGPALSPSDLLLLKLQVVQLNQKDAVDALTLLLQFEPAPEDSDSTISTDYIGQVCGDWGWYTTLRDNLAKVRTMAESILTSEDDITSVQRRVDGLSGALERMPKSISWKLRDKVGRRVAWYQLPEEVAE